MFPVLWQGDRKYLARLEELKCPRNVPWDFIAEHEEQCLTNHGQTAQRLSERGGLAPSEMVAVIERIRFRHMVRMTTDEEVQRLTALLDAYQRHRVSP
jgi:hypothetical protein